MSELLHATVLRQPPLNALGVAARRIVWPSAVAALYLWLRPCVGLTRRRCCVLQPFATCSMVCCMLQPCATCSMVCCMLQALRWRLRSCVGLTRRRVLESYISADLFGRDQSGGRTQARWPVGAARRRWPKSGSRPHWRYSTTGPIHAGSPSHGQYRVGLVLAVTAVA